MMYAQRLAERELLPRWLRVTGAKNCMRSEGKRHTSFVTEELRSMRWNDREGNKLLEGNVRSNILLVITPHNALYHWRSFSGLHETVETESLSSERFPSCLVVMCGDKQLKYS
jgi:hypothetical protein